MSTPGTSKLARARAALTRQRLQGRELTTRAVGAGVSVATGAALGYLRGRLSEDDGSFNVPATDIPYEAAYGVIAGAAGLLGYGGTMSAHLLASGQTALALATARMTEDSGKKAKAEADKK